MTAVEWLYDEIKHIIPNDFLNKFEQAKEMERQQIEVIFENTYTNEEVYNLLEFLGKDKQDLYKWFGQFKRKQL